MDLTGFIVGGFPAGGVNGSGVADASYSIFNHLASYWDVDYGARGGWAMHARPTQYPPPSPRAAAGHTGAWVSPNTSSPSLRIIGNDQMKNTGQWITWPAHDTNATYVPVQDIPGINSSFPFVDMVASADNPDDILATLGWLWFDQEEGAGGHDDGDDATDFGRMRRRIAERDRRNRAMHADPREGRSEGENGGGGLVGAAVAACFRHCRAHLLRRLCAPACSALHGAQPASTYRYSQSLSNTHSEPGEGMQGRGGWVRGREPTHGRCACMAAAANL